LDISIVIPTYNRSPLLKKCLDSLVKQDYPAGDFEVIVCDDGSSDDTRGISRSFAEKYGNIRYLYQPHKGVAAARNLGIRNSSAGLIAFVADDYTLDPGYASVAVNFFRSSPDAQVLRFKIVNESRDFLSRADHFSYDIYIIGLLERSHARGGRLIGKSFHLPASGAAVFRKEIFGRVGQFDEELEVGEDIEMGWRLKKSSIGIYYCDYFSVKRNYKLPLSGHLRKRFLYGETMHMLKRKYPEHPINFPVSGRGSLVFAKNFLFYPVEKYLLMKKASCPLLFFPVHALLDSSYVLGVLLVGIWKKPSRKLPPVF